MSLNCAEIEEAVSFFPQNVIIKAFFQSDKNTLIISCYDKNDFYNILINTEDKCNRICLIPKTEKIIAEKNRFANFLGAKLIGTKIRLVTQINLSRVVCFILESGSEKYKLYVRLWGNAGNIIFTNENDEIIECLKRYPGRNEWPEEIFKIDEKKNDLIFKIRNEFSGDIENINNLIYHFYKKEADQIKFVRLKKGMLDSSNKELAKFSKQLTEMKRNTTNDKINEYLKTGELLKSNLFNIKTGDKFIKVFDYETDKEVILKLKDNLTPQENVKYYFEKYKRSKDAKEKLSEEIKALEEKVTVLNEKIYKINVIETEKELNDYIRSKKSIEKRTATINVSESAKIGRKYILSDSYTAFVSRSSKEGDELFPIHA